MNTAQLKQLWEQNFKVVPDDDILDLMAQFASRSIEDEKTLLWLLMKSSARLFKDESARALWIAEQVKANLEGAPLPAFNDPIQSA